MTQEMYAQTVEHEQEFNLWLDTLPKTEDGENIMNHEYETHAEIKGERRVVVASYELDGYKPIIYGIFDEDDNDVTELVDYDRIYTDLCADIIGTAADAADYLKGDR